MANTIDPGHFRVLIAGGGPVGLTAAHTLHQAGIDFVLLERRESAIVQAGSNLVLFPNGLRALGQLGLYDAFVAAGSPLTHTTRQNHDGQDMGTNHFFPLFNEQ